MDKLIPHLYKNYGDYCNNRMLPNEIDGLRPVERRVLLSVYQIARNKFVKSVKIDGFCLGHYHPHSSSYGTIVQMVYQNFIIGQGNFGIPFDTTVKAAASRYTMVKLNPKMEKLAFELIKYVTWKELELDKEPLYLPVMYPLCFLGNIYIAGIGFGYKTLIPNYKQNDLYERLLYLIGIRKKKPIIKPLSDCKILSNDSDIEKLLISGKSKIKFCGIYEVNNDFSVSLKSWPYGMKIETLIANFKKELESGDIGYSDFSDSKKNIVFKVLKQRNKSEILDKFIKKLDIVITREVSFDIIIVDEKGLVKQISVDQLLLNAYNNYTKFSKKMLEIEKARYENILFEYETLEKLRPFLSKHLNEIVNNYDEIIRKINKESKISENVIKILFSKYKINKLLTLKIDKNEIVNKMKYFDDKLKNIKKYILQKYREV